MNAATLISRSLRFHWRTSLGVMLAAAVATAVLVGAMAVGDCIRGSLRMMAMQRLGGTQVAIVGGDHFFRQQLAADMGKALSVPTAGVMQLAGVAYLPDRSALANNVQVLGVTETFWQLGGNAGGLPPLKDGVILNRRLADQLGVWAGREVWIRVSKPSLLSRDMPLSSDDDAYTSFLIKLPVLAVAEDSQMGRFGLQANQTPPFTAMVPLALVQRGAKLEGQINLLLIGGDRDVTADRARAALADAWQLADVGLSIRKLDDPPGLEVRSSRVFIEDEIARAAAGDDATGILTYFVNKIRCGEKTTPYSIVTGIGPLMPPGESKRGSKMGPGIAPSPKDDEIVISQWEADDLGIASGASPAFAPTTSPAAEIDLTYFTVESLRNLQTATAGFKLAGVAPAGGLVADRTLLPEFPGISEQASTANWKTGIPIDMKKIRPKDEKYWTDFRGTPKAFISLAAAQKMWSNRYGNLTAIRFPAGEEPALAARLRAKIDPGKLGLVIIPLREQALAAGSPTTDFGGLFIGFSLFLIVAALLLMGLLFVLGIQQRSGELGTLLAVGLRPSKVRRLMLGEGLVLAVGGSVLGAAGGLLYTKAMLWGLSTLWRQAVASAAVQFMVEPATVVASAAGSVVAAMLAMWLMLRRHLKMPARALLAGVVETPTRNGKRRRIRLSLWICILSAIGAGATLWSAAGSRGSSQETAEYFFIAGALLLVAALAACGFVLRHMLAHGRQGNRGQLTRSSLAIHNAGRRPGRSLATIAMLACGTFLVVAVGAYRQEPGSDAGRTGGFALWGQTTLPLYRDVNSPDGQREYNVDPQSLRGAHVAMLRLREGAEASCLNLNRPSQPRVLGVRTADFESRFTFVKVWDPKPPADWTMLDQPWADGEIPAVADENTILYGLGKTVGDTLDYTDDHGRPVRLRLVGMIGNSILQGSVIIAQANFEKHFAGEGGYRVVLVDLPAGAKDDATAVSAALTQRLSRWGLELEPAARRLAEFQAVENAYLSIFQVLGGLGLVLGSVGLALVVMRNVLERRGELALLRAVGFTRGRLRALVLGEHAVLLAMGLACGVAAALLATLPSGHVGVPVSTLAAVLASGLLWTLIATLLATRGNLITAMRDE